MLYKEFVKFCLTKQDFYRKIYTYFFLIYPKNCFECGMLMTPVALFGLSGVGKTTLVHGLTNLAPYTFSIASITTSRAPRSDDDLRYIEFFSEIDFISSIAQRCFALSWKQDGNYYGYRDQYLKNTQTHPILTCSLSAIQKLKEYEAITVLVTGDSIKGLQARGCKEVIKKKKSA